MTQPECSWKEVDRRLAAIAKQRATLDAEEARWLREAARVEIWREVGCVSLLDYMERRLGYGPRAAQDRVRVALALAELPGLESALAGGMPYTAVRELTRVAKSETEQAWLDACRGATVHEIEQAVSGHRKGSLPSDPPEPDLATRTLSFDKIAPATIALLRQARHKARDERGVHLSDNDLLAMILGAFIEGPATDSDRGRAKYQIALELCPKCDQGWQQGAGRRFAMESADVERAKCDAQHIGSLDGDPERATQDVPPRFRRFVFRRDRGTCSLPGCRSTRCLELHHIVPRWKGGSNDPSNLILLCDGCHAAHHRGLIAISGRPGALVVERLIDRAHVGADGVTGVAVGDVAFTVGDVGAADRVHVGAEWDRGHDPVGGAVSNRANPSEFVVVGARVGAVEHDREDDDLGRDADLVGDTVATRAGGHSDLVGDTVATRAGTNEHVVESDRARVGAEEHEQAGDMSANRAGIENRALVMSKLERATIQTQSLDALVRVGFKRHEARAAVDAATREVGDSSYTLEGFLRSALSKTPRPRGG